MLTQIFNAILSTSATTSLVIIFVLIARFLLKKSPKVFSYALWGVVLFRLVCPVTFESDFSIIPSPKSAEIYSNFVEIDAVTLNDISQEIVNEELPSDMDFIPQGGTLNQPTPVTPSIEIEIDRDYVTEIESNTSVVGGDVATNDKLDLMGILSYIWLVGFIVMSCFGVREFVKLHKSLIGCTRWKDCKYGDNIYLCDNIKSPFVMGLFKAKIYIPSNIMNKDLDYIISHEKHHILRLDHITRIIGFIALSLHWFNPFVWIAFVLSGKDMELSCDEYVLGRADNTSVDIRADYSQALLYFACNLNCRRKLIAITPHAFGESGSTKERIVNIMTYKKTAVWVTVLLAGLVGLTSVALASDKTTDTTSIDEAELLEFVYFAYDEDPPKLTEPEIEIIESVESTPLYKSLILDDKYTIVNENYWNYFMGFFQQAEQVDTKPAPREEVYGQTTDTTHQLKLTLADDTVRHFEMTGDVITEFVGDDEFYYQSDSYSPRYFISELLEENGEFKYDLGRSFNSMGNPYSNANNERMDNITSIKLTYDSDDIVNAINKTGSIRVFDNTANLSELVINNQDYINYIADSIYYKQLIHSSIYSVPGGLDFNIEFTFNDGTVIEHGMADGVLYKATERNDVGRFVDGYYMALNYFGYNFFEELLLNGNVSGLGDPSITKEYDASNKYTPEIKSETVINNLNATLVDQNDTLIKNTSVRLIEKYAENYDNSVFFVTDNNGVLQGELPHDFTTGEYVFMFNTTDSYGQEIDSVQFIQDITTENANNLTIAVPYTHQNIEKYTHGTNFKPLDIYIKDENGNPVVNALVKITYEYEEAWFITPHRIDVNSELQGIILGSFTYTNDDGCAKFTSNKGDYTLECIVDGEIVLTENINLEDVDTELEFTV